MINRIKGKVTSIIGLVFLLIGIVFVLLPGPAILFLPLGLALLSLEYPWAKVWLRKTQRWLRASAVKTDRFFSWLKYKLRK